MDVTDTNGNSFDTPAAVRRFAQQHYGKALSFIAALHYSQADTDRVVSEVLAGAIRRADERQPGEDWSAFVGTLAAQRVRRQLARHQQGPLLAYYRCLARHMVDDEATAAYFQSLRSRFSICAKRVNRTEFDALKLRYGHGLDIEAVARQSGRPVAAVRRGLRRVRLRLAECMHDRELSDDAAATPAQELTLRYLDDGLSQRELDEMQWRVDQDPAERERHIALLALETLLATMARRADAVAELVVRRLWDDGAATPQTDEPQAVDPALAEVAAASAGTTPPGRRTTRRRKRTQATLQLTLLALLLAGVAAAAWIYRDRLAFQAPKPTPSAAVLERKGKITYERDGTSYLLRETTVLQSGDVVHVRDQAELVLAFDRAGRFTILPGSSVRIEQGNPQASDPARPPRRLVLVTGAIDAEVAPLDRAAPIQLYTPHADLRAENARFTVRAKADRTRVAVDAGSLAVRRRADNKQVQLAAGEAVLVAPGERMSPALAENHDGAGDPPAAGRNTSADAPRRANRLEQDQAGHADPAPSVRAREDNQRPNAPADQTANNATPEAEAEAEAGNDGEAMREAAEDAEEPADEPMPDGGANAIHAREAIMPPISRR